MPKMSSTVTETVPPTSKRSSRSKKSRRSSKSSQASSDGRSGADQAKSIQAALEKLTTQLGWSDITKSIDTNFKPKSRFDNWYAINKLRETVSRTVGSEALPEWLATEDTTGLTGSGESKVDTKFKSWVDGLESTIMTHQPKISAWTKMGPLKGVLAKKVKRALDKDTRLRATSSRCRPSAPTQSGGSRRSKSSKSKPSEKTIEPTTGNGTAREEQLDKQRSRSRSRSEAGSPTSSTRASKNARSRSRDTSASTADTASRSRKHSALTTSESLGSKTTPPSSATSSSPTTSKSAPKLTREQIRERMRNGYGMPPSSNATNATIDPTTARGTSAVKGGLTREQISNLTGAQIAEMANGAAPALDQYARQTLSPEHIRKAESGGPVDVSAMASKLTSMFTAKHFETLGSEIPKRAPRFFMQDGKLVEERTIQSIAPDGTRSVLTRWIYDGETNNPKWMEKKDIYVPQGSSKPPSWAIKTVAPGSTIPQWQTTQGTGKPGLFSRVYNALTAPSSAPPTSPIPPTSPLLRPTATASKPPITSPFSTASYVAPPTSFAPTHSRPLSSYASGVPFTNNGAFTGQTYTGPVTGLRPSEMASIYPTGGMSSSPSGIGASGVNSMPAMFGMV